jgi:ribosomal protein S18 acetylase RimI-like enzyme
MLDKEIIVRELNTGEELRANQLIHEVFSQFIAPSYDQEGINEFLRYIDPDLIRTRLQSNHFGLVAEINGSFVGILEVRTFSHISLLFVSSKFQRKGIGTKLLDEALAIIKINAPDIKEITVNSSPNAVNAYQALGFEIKGPERVEYGIRYIPMSLNMDDKEGR